MPNSLRVLGCLQDAATRHMC